MALTLSPEYKITDTGNPVYFLFSVAMHALDNTMPLPKRMVFTKVLAYNVVMLVMRTHLRHHMVHMVRQAVSMIEPSIRLPPLDKPPVKWLEEVLEKKEDEGPEEWIERVAHVSLAHKTTKELKGIFHV